MRLPLKWLWLLVALGLPLAPGGLTLPPPALAQTAPNEAQLEEANRLLNLGAQQYRVSQWPEALQSWQAALEMYQALGDRAGEAITLNNIGVIYEKQGNYGEALATYQQSLTMRRDLGDRAGEASTLNNIGNIYGLQGNYAEALATYQQSLTISRDLGDRAGEARTLMGIGAVHQLQGNYGEALATYQQSLTMLRDLGDRAGEARTLNNIGTLWNFQGETALAIVFLKASVNVYEDIRQSNQSLEQSLKDSYLTTIEGTYRWLADLLIQQERVLEAQRVLDLLKVQELDTFLRGVRSNSNTQAGVELVPPEAQIVAAYDALVDRAIANGKRLSELEAKPSLTAAEETEMVALQGERRELLQAFNQFRTSDLVQGALAQLSPTERDRNLQLGQLAALQDNLSQIPQGAVLLYPFILEDRLELVVTSPYAPPIHRSVNVTPAQLAAAVQAFRYALEEPTRDAITPAQQLYDWLIAPIEADLQAAGVNTLIYAPDRVLRYIPLAALHDGDQWLAERYRINHITAASLTDLNTPPITQPRILAGALTEGPVTVEAGGRDYTFPFLRHAEAEVNGIAALDPRVNPLLGANFSPDQVEREANRHTIVHLATHAKFLVGQPEDSFILFSNRDRWTLADFNAGLLNLTRVDLVVLSACETGVDNTFGNGEEILGFGYLMQAAGARAAIASLWAVDDGGTQILMGEFYDALLRGGLGKAEALRQAQLSLIHLGRRETRGFELATDLGLDPNDLAHPHYWAPFILIGNGL